MGIFTIVTLIACLVFREGFLLIPVAFFADAAVLAVIKVLSTPARD